MKIKQRYRILVRVTVHLQEATMKAIVGVAQFAPAVLDLQACVEKACAIIAGAGRLGVQILAFPETWIPAYPVWVDMGSFGRWNHAPSKQLYARMYRNSLDLRSAEMDRLLDACRTAHVFVVIGVNERDRRSRSLWNTLLFISEKGMLAGSHRKLVPTFGERLLWGQGDGKGLDVHETPWGGIGGLICWEHWMPSVRQHLHEQAETIHVASWPHGGEIHQLASRHYAFEGRCFVLAAAQYLEKGMFPSDYEFSEELDRAPDVLLPGGSAIIAPDASYIVPPVLGKEELLVAEIETEHSVRESLLLDPAGHYSRPDLFHSKEPLARPAPAQKRRTTRTRKRKGR